jgi:RND superfamily putative drug exporter
LGRWSFRRRKLVGALWVALLAVATTLGLAFGKGTDDTFTIPGTESQSALDELGRLFPELSGTFAQFVLTVPDGQTVDTPDIRRAVSESVDRQKDLDQVVAVASPFDSSVSGGISADHTAAIIVDQLSVPLTGVHANTKSALQREAAALQHALDPTVDVAVGGDAFADRVPRPSPTEAIGIVIAMILLYLFFRYLGAAFLPICTAVLGVAITEMLITTATSTVTIMATAPMLATMIGLAVGIDYALFIISRHRDQLASGIEPEESAARAVATAGSAVVFAGVTVIIALLGLFVAGLPFLTIMGLCAAMGVAFAVAIAVTVTPAAFGFLGPRLRPKASTRRKKPNPNRRSLPSRWVILITRRPVITITAVLLVVGALAWPVTSMRLALPGNESEPVGNLARDTYDLVSGEFGAGYNGPLIVTVNLLSSRTPVQDIEALKHDLARLDGVASAPLATPNPRGEIGVVQVIPSSGPDSPATTELVQRLREAGPGLASKYGFRDFAVTGITAVQVDTSAKLGAAMMPFGIFVVGLSLLLLVMVFRSITVPIKATLGYVLSVLAAFGATTAVFVDGWGATLLGVAHTGPLVSFLPIIVMGVLFGLAMDYEVFLVSRTAEEYHRTHDPDQSIRHGFEHAAPVVTTAALIMLGVFVTFIPAPNATIKSIAFALTVGVFVDAFLVRMTLVPAVMKLLGHAAWWLPAAWQRRLPRFDVEGEGVQRQLRLADWPTDPREVVSASGLHLIDTRGEQLLAPLDLHAAAGEIHLLVGPEGSGKSAALAALAGRINDIHGDAKVGGNVLPDLARAVRRHTTLIRVAETAHPEDVLHEAAQRRRAVLLIDDIDLIVGANRTHAVGTALSNLLSNGAVLVAAASSPEAIAPNVLPAHPHPVIHRLDVPTAVALAAVAAQEPT